MKEIIPPVEKKLLYDELTQENFVRRTNNGDNELYIFTHKDSPNLMREIGRLRELTFRKAGGGTGKELDIDEYDISDHPYSQLIVWDPLKEEILGGYRFFICDEEVTRHAADKLATSRLFHFSEQFKKKYLPHTIELGRSFVQPVYQSTSRQNKGIYALDNLWDGLGTLVINNPSKKYFFGKVTMYRNYNQRARNLILYFLEKHFPDNENLVTPIDPISTHMDLEEMKRIFDGDTYIEDYKTLSQKVRAFGENIPPLINAYMNLSPSMKTFGTVLNNHFGKVEETAMIITINEIYKAKVERHISTYDPADQK